MEDIIINQLPQRGAALMSALADPTRKTIFNMLLEKTLLVKHMAADLPISQSAVSQHLKVMRVSGLVLEEKQGRGHWYSINPVALDWLSWQFGLLRDDVLQDAKDQPNNEPEYDAVDQAMEQWSRQWSELDAVSNAVMLRLFLIGRQLGQHFDRLADSFGMSSDQVSLLSTLDRLPSHSCQLQALIQTCFLQPNANTAQLAPLEARDFIAQTNSEDANDPLITLTSQGQTVLHELLASQNKLGEAPIAKMTPENRIKLAKLLRPFLADILPSNTTKESKP